MISGSPTLLAQVMQLVYSDLHPYLVRLWVEPAFEVSELVDQLDQMLVDIASAPDADHRTAQMLADGSKQLLSRVKEGDAFRLCQIAVRYLILEDDGDDDAISLFGFDDDAELFNAVCEVLGEPDLRVCLG